MHDGTWALKVFSKETLIASWYRAEKGWIWSVETLNRRYSLIEAKSIESKHFSALFNFSIYWYNSSTCLLNLFRRSRDQKFLSKLIKQWIIGQPLSQTVAEFIANAKTIEGHRTLSSVYLAFSEMDALLSRSHWVCKNYAIFCILSILATQIQNIILKGCLLVAFARQSVFWS